MYNNVDPYNVVGSEAIGQQGKLSQTLTGVRRQVMCDLRDNGKSIGLVILVSRIGGIGRPSVAFTDFISSIDLAKKDKLDGFKYAKGVCVGTLFAYVEHHEKFAMKDKELQHIGERIAEYNTMIVKKLDEFETKMGGREKWVVNNA